MHYSLLTKNIIRGLVLGTVFLFPVAGFALDEETKALNKQFFKEADKSKDDQLIADSLRAPFPTEVTKSNATQNDLINMYVGPTTEGAPDAGLDSPHRQPYEIAEWGTDVASQMFTITIKKWEQDKEKLKKFFTPYAWKEYSDYLASSKTLDVLVERDYYQQAISDEVAMVVKEGAIGGSYHWLIEIPIMVSYYKNVDGKKNAVQSQNFFVQLQLGRIEPKNASDIGLLVERIKVSSVRK